MPWGAPAAQQLESLTERVHDLEGTDRRLNEAEATRGATAEIIAADLARARGEIKSARREIERLEERIESHNLTINILYNDLKKRLGDKAVRTIMMRRRDDLDAQRARFRRY
jgi:uncharacterized protein (UPF0335 family)